MLYITNSAGLFTSLTRFYVYGRTFKLDEVKKLFKNEKNNLVSAIGDKNTAKFLSKLSGFEIPDNTITINLKNRDCVLAFFLSPPIPKDVVITEKEMQKYSYKFLFYQIFYEFSI